MSAVRRGVPSVRMAVKAMRFSFSAFSAFSLSWASAVSYTHLNRYWGCCPFHHEKTASFSVVPDKGFFYCFGCHAGGNAFKFISLIENISYFDAIKLQAEKLGIPLPERKRSCLLYTSRCV